MKFGRLSLRFQDGAEDQGHFDLVKCFVIAKRGWATNFGSLRDHCTGRGVAKFLVSQQGFMLYRQSVY